jgi:stress-induced-phosphoprotein 1
MSAEGFKQKGNEALKIGDNKSACEYYTQGLEIEPENFTILSNRAAAYLALGNFQKSLEDGETLLKIQPKWSKSYLRHGTALKFLKRFEEAAESFSKGLEIEPENAQLIKLYGEVEKELQKASKTNLILNWTHGILPLSRKA